MGDAATRKLIGATVATLVKDTLLATQEQIARDASTGELTRRFDMAMQIAVRRGMPEDRARDTALAAVLQEQADRMMKRQLGLTILAYEKTTKAIEGEQRVRLITEG